MNISKRTAYIKCRLLRIKQIIRKCMDGENIPIRLDIIFHEIMLKEA